MPDRSRAKQPTVRDQQTNTQFAEGFSDVGRDTTRL
jgi:hypothetical protein